MKARRLLWAALLVGCVPVGFGVWIEPAPEPPPEPPVPTRLVGDRAPELEALDEPGLYRTRAGPALYFHEPSGLWYRYWKGSWYQAFFWNGAWFPPESVPESLREGPPRP